MTKQEKREAAIKRYDEAWKCLRRDGALVPPELAESMMNCLMKELDWIEKHED